MTIRERPSGAAIILDVDGRMTIGTVNDRPLTVEVRRLLQEGQRRILVNLKGVPYLDTSGLCDVVEGYRDEETRRSPEVAAPDLTCSNGAGHDAAVDDSGSLRFRSGCDREL